MPDSALNFNHNQPVYSVSEISQSIKRMVEDHFGVVRIRGEISGHKAASSGHVYFRLKDDTAVIDAVCWRGTTGKLACKPEDGLEVICTGRITTYPGKSSYQIIVDNMEPAGIGALMALLEKRRKQFEAEGLFALERKKKLPFMPMVVGVITSPTGAVIRDILHRLADRFPVHVLVWPVAVQGEAAAPQVAEAIAGMNAIDGSTLPRPDVLIVARGGGSIEDLWAFNEEIVVRAAASSAIPLISAVGHETDTTLIDHVADRRAPTPTAAAEMAVPVREELQLGIEQLGVRLSGAMQQWMARKREQLEGLSRGLPKPSHLLDTVAQRLDDWSERLGAALPASLHRREQQLAVLSASLKPQTLMADMRKTGDRLEDFSARMRDAALRIIERREERLKNLSSLLDSVDYRKVLERGFALVRDAQGHLVSSAKQAAAAGDLSITFADGDIKVRR